MLVVLMLSACAINPTAPIARIALLAPFEGRYRDIGYSAIYPARMALRDMGITHLELVAVDDGGTFQTAQERARALALDTSIKAVMILGYDSADSSVQAVFGDMPIIIIGEWATQPINNRVFMLTNPQIPGLLTQSGRIDITDAAQVETPFIGGEIFGLQAYSELRPNTDDIQILTSGMLAPIDFAERLIASDIFVPAPNHLSLMVYDVTRLLAQVIVNPDMTRDMVADGIRNINYEGIVGRIRFDESGYWADAPIYTYIYENGKLILAP
jgi:ABC-type branched-subunit amino acid transport system substrate-binding protein